MLGVYGFRVREKVTVHGHGMNVFVFNRTDEATRKEEPREEKPRQDEMSQDTKRNAKHRQIKRGRERAKATHEERIFFRTHKHKYTALVSRVRRLRG